MEIKVLGTGCSKCKTLESYVQKALQELGVTAKVEKVSDVAKIMEYDIFMTPGLVINGQTVASGRLPNVEEIKGWLSGQK